MKKLLFLALVLALVPAHGIERRRGRDRTPPVFELLPGGPYESQLGQDRLQGSRGESVATTRASTYTCANYTGVSNLSNNIECMEPRGLSVYAAASNLMQRSDEAEQWGRLLATTATANADTAPDGTLTADRIHEDNTNNQHLADHVGITTVIGTTYTMSVYAKAGTRNWVYSVKSGGTQARAWFNLTTCTVGTVEAGVTASISGPDSRGFCRLVAVVDGPGHIGGVSTNFGWALANADGSASYLGGGASQYAIFWRSQVEAGTFATPAIQTVAVVPVQRNADVIEATLPEQPVAEGSIFTDFAAYGAGERYVLDSRPVACTNNGGHIFLVNTSSGVMSAFLLDSGGGVAQTDSTVLAWTSGTTYRIGMAWRNGVLRVFRNGADVTNGTGAYAITPALFNGSWVIGGRCNRSGGASWQNGYISDFCVSKSYEGCRR
jgi:hypothetical protein